MSAPFRKIPVYSMRLVNVKKLTQVSFCNLIVAYRQLYASTSMQPILIKCLKFTQSKAMHMFTFIYI
jgi:hypothetical protein